MLLVGSRALETYISIPRICHDWDIWMTHQEYDDFFEEFKQYLIKTTSHSSLFEIKGEIFEVKKENQFDPTDKLIFNCAKSNHSITVPIINRICDISQIQIIFDMKAATAECIDEPKHKFDLELMRSKFKVEENTEIFQIRLEETKKRIAASDKVKYDFFHKYHIPEYIKHDYLHEIIADLLDIKIPTYLRITTADTDIGEDLFNALTYDQKIDLMVEESLVLALERWLIPQMIENGINASLIPMFYNNNEGLPTYKILKHCNITGLKGEAEYIVNFGRNNFFEIEKKWQKAKVQIKNKGGLPAEFFDKLFELREKYKKGIKIGFHENK